LRRNQEQNAGTGNSGRTRCLDLSRAVASGTRLRSRSHAPHIDSRHELHACHPAGDRGHAVRWSARRTWLGVRALGARNVCRGRSVGPGHVIGSGVDGGEAPGRHLSHLVGRHDVALHTSRYRANGTEAMALAVGSAWGLRPGALVQCPQSEGGIGLSHPATAVPHTQPPHRATDCDAWGNARGHDPDLAAVLDVCGRHRAYGDRHTSVPTWDESPGGSRADCPGGSNSNGELSLRP